MDRIENSLLWRLLHASLWEWIGLIVALVVLVWLVVRIRTLVREDEDATADDQGLLTQINELRREGDLSEAEYRSIKRRLLDRLGERM